MARGGAGRGQGRKPKAEELRVRDTAVEAITEKYGSLKEGFLALLRSPEASLVKWVFEHAAGKPTDKLDVVSNGQTIGQAQEVVIKDYSKK
jgi:hypothetical protein